MVRFNAGMLVQTGSLVRGFNPTMVRFNVDVVIEPLLQNDVSIPQWFDSTCADASPTGDLAQFQSHNGSIQRGGQCPGGSARVYVSIPQWFDSTYGHPVHARHLV